MINVCKFSKLFLRLFQDQTACFAFMRAHSIFKLIMIYINPENTIVEIDSYDK